MTRVYSMKDVLKPSVFDPIKHYCIFTVNGKKKIIANGYCAIAFVQSHTFDITNTDDQNVR